MGVCVIYYLLLRLHAHEMLFHPWSSVITDRLCHLRAVGTAADLHLCITPGIQSGIRMQLSRLEGKICNLEYLRYISNYLSYLLYTAYIDRTTSYSLFSRYLCAPAIWLPVVGRLGCLPWRQLDSAPHAGIRHNDSEY
ncbi:hypothetical protein F5X97DRAFT_128995 [Nemania serpens]|nr:hypothetical protein F5X97DRAFT_128995 [Nemania serpens]